MITIYIYHMYASPYLCHFSNVRDKIALVIFIMKNCPSDEPSINAT